MSYNNSMVKQKVDFLGQALQIGDEVVLIRPRYRELAKAKIVGETDCFFYVEFNSRNSATTIKQTSNQLVKIKATK